MIEIFHEDYDNKPKLIDSIHEGTRETILDEDFGMVSPALLLFKSPYRPMLIPIEDRSEETKILLQAKVRELDPNIIILVMEGWALIKDLPTEIPEDGSIANHPDRKEVIITMGFQKGTTPSGKMSIVDREDDKLILREAESMHDLIESSFIPHEWYLESTEVH